MDIQYLMKQAKKLEKAMSDARETLGDLRVEGESGGGLVKVTMNGKCEVVTLAVDPSIVDPAEKAVLEDLLAAAINSTAEKARAAADAHLQQATGGVKIPGFSG